MRVQIIRGSGDIQADPIINKLAATENAGKELGRNFLDAEGFDKINFDIEMPYRSMPLPGKVVQVNDASLGVTFKTKLIGWGISVSGLASSSAVTVRTSISLERSAT